MEVTTIMTWIAALGAISEALSLIPGVKANGLFQIIWNVLKIIGGDKTAKEE